jgi:hypothetical protein
VTWAEGRGVYEPNTVEYGFEAKSVPDEPINSLLSYLNKTGRICGQATPLCCVHVCDLFDGDIEFLVDKARKLRTLAVSSSLFSAKRSEFVLLPVP